jgi:transposase
MAERITIKLHPMQRKKLERRAKRTTDAAERSRYLIVLKYDQGKGATVISRELHCAHSTPHRVAKRFLELGEAGLVDGRCDNGNVKADERCYAVLARLLEGSPRDYGWARPTWTQELFRKQIEAETGVSLCLGTISKMLKRLRARRGRPKPTVGCPWGKRKRKKRLRELQELAENLPPGEEVLHEDEVDIHLNPKIGPDWMLPATQKTVETPGQNEKRYMAGALNVKTGDVHHVEGDRKASVLFIKLLQYLVTTCYSGATRIHLILDNYIIHTSKITQRAIEALDGRVVLHFLPPYCPDENRIELLWKQLHDNVTRNHRCPTMEALMTEARAFMQAASPFPGSSPSLRRTG